jgi:histidinol-phosphatase (PHP family)
MKEYHTHTWRCNHAKGDVEEYCASALERHVTVLGISDHTPLPDDRWLFRRMKYEQLDDYVASIARAREVFPALSVLTSMECDYLSEYEPFYREELLGKRSLQYLIGAVHWFPTKTGWVEVPDGRCEKDHLFSYTRQYIAAIADRDFLFMAHPDIFGSFYPLWDSEAESCSRAILAAARDSNVVLEINSHGLRKSRIKTDRGEWRKYPILQFWELAADYGIRVVINSDAHHPDHLTMGSQECYDIARGLNLEIADFSFLESDRAFLT